MFKEPNSENDKSSVVKVFFQKIKGEPDRQVDVINQSGDEFRHPTVKFPTVKL